MPVLSASEYLDSKAGFKTVVDHMYIHADDIGGPERHVTNIAGDFHGNPIIYWNPAATTEREIKEAAERISKSRAWAAAEAGAAQ